MKKFPTLYKRSATGKIQQWTITVNGDSYTVTEGIVDGKLTTTAPHTCEGKNPGKKNETTPEQQAIKEAQSVYEKKLRRGYTEDVTKIDNTGFEKPCKGYKWADHCDEVVFPVTIQDKINGVNFRIKEAGVISTGGEFYLTVPHIIESLAPLFEKYPDLVLMGEGYNPNAEYLHQITEILTVTKKEKDLTPELLELSEQVSQAWLFDGYGFEGITKTTPWEERHAAVSKLVKGFKYIYMLPYKTVENKEELAKEVEKNKERKQEGLMIRWGGYPIKHGKSKYLLKYKHMEDAEYEVEAIEEGNGDWAGKAKRIILKLPKPTKDRDGNTVTNFAANIRGTMPYLEKLWREREQIIGEKATVEYPSKSEYGIPQTGWVTAIRNYEGELDE